MVHRACKGPEGPVPRWSGPASYAVSSSRTRRRGSGSPTWEIWKLSHAETRQRNRTIRLSIGRVGESRNGIRWRRARRAPPGSNLVGVISPRARGSQSGLQHLLDFSILDSDHVSITATGPQPLPLMAVWAAPASVLYAPSARPPLRVLEDQQRDHFLHR
jgi:hypothetical protein